MQARRENPVVLLVDDNLEYLENLNEALASLGYTCLMAESAECGLALVRDHRPGAVVSDVHLPGLSGVELLCLLRKERFEGRVVLMSAFADSEVLLAAEAAGAPEVLPKPVALDRLVNLLSEREPEEEA